MTSSNIPKDKVLEIVRKEGTADIANVMCGLNVAGYKHPKTEVVKDGEAADPYITDLSNTLNSMAESGELVRDFSTGKYTYSIPATKA